MLDDSPWSGTRRIIIPRYLSIGLDRTAVHSSVWFRKYYYNINSSSRGYNDNYYYAFSVG